MAQKESPLRNETKVTAFGSNCENFSTQAMELRLYLLNRVGFFGGGGVDCVRFHAGAPC